MNNHQIMPKIWPKFEENPCSTTTLETISPWSITLYVIIFSLQKF